MNGNAALERQRLTFLRGRSPNYFLPPPPAARARLRALQLLHRGRLEEGLDLLEEANAGADGFAGSVDGREFEGWRDEDDRLGDTLELAVGDRIYWLPMVQVLSLKLSPRGEMVDFYLPVEIRIAGADPLSARLPVRYVESSEHPEESIRTAEETDLYADEAGCARALGLRSWQVGDDAFTPWDIVQIEKGSGRIGLV